MSWRRTQTPLSVWNSYGLKSGRSRLARAIPENSTGGGSYWGHECTGDSTERARRRNRPTARRYWANPLLRRIPESPARSSIARGTRMLVPETPLACSTAHSGGSSTCAFGVFNTPYGGSWKAHGRLRWGVRDEASAAAANLRPAQRVRRGSGTALSGQACLV